MPHHVRAILLVAVSLAALPPTIATAAIRPPAPAEQAKQRLAQLSSSARRERAPVRRRIGVARRVGTSNPCRAARLLKALPLRGSLRAQALGAQAALMVLSRARSCGGTPSAHAGDANATVLESSAARLRLRLT